MERTLEIMMEELRILKEEKKPLSQKIKVINNKINSIEDEIETYKLNNELYHPMSELFNHKGKEISHITLVERDEYGMLDTRYMYNDEIFDVDEDGHLYYSSYYYGIMRYDEKIGKYVKKYYCSSTEHDYVGYLEVKFEDD